MKIIGVTGPIGSGKSTVSEMISRKGAKLIDADKVYAGAVRRGQPALKDIVDYFGKEILDKNQELDRKKLGEIVFNNSVKLTKLNEITHKYVIEKIREEINIEKNNCCDMIALECQIPVEHGFLDIVDIVVVVVANVETRVERIMKRNNMKREEALKRINAQMGEQEYVKVADIVIKNDSNYDELEDQLKSILNLKLLE